MRGGTLTRLSSPAALRISIHPPRAGRDDFRLYLCVCANISIHPPRAGRDCQGFKGGDFPQDFNPPAPCGAGPAKETPCRPRYGHFNPPAPCGAGRSGAVRCRSARSISIHPPRAGRDFCPSCGYAANGKISIHPPRAGRDKNVVSAFVHKDISIHPPRAGRDEQFGGFVSMVVQFQSTRPVRGGTITSLHLARDRYDFNPPAPCGAGPAAPRYRPYTQHFNPPAPCGAGLPIVSMSGGHLGFQSTRPVRGGTLLRRLQSQVDLDFNPPAPCGAGRSQSWTLSWMQDISIHPPRAGRDVPPALEKTNPSLFQSTRPVRGGTSTPSCCAWALIFQSTRPVRGGTICTIIQTA